MYNYVFTLTYVIEHDVSYINSESTEEQQEEDDEQSVIHPVHITAVHQHGGFTSTPVREKTLTPNIRGNNNNVLNVLYLITI